MQVSYLAILFSMVFAGKSKQESTNESISINKQLKSISKCNRNEPVVIYTKSKPTHNILVGRKAKKQEISYEGCHRDVKRPIKVYSRKSVVKKPVKKPKISVSWSWSSKSSGCSSDTSSSSSSSSSSSTTVVRHRKRHQHKRGGKKY